MAEDGKRTFVAYKDGEQAHEFRNRTPRGAALKAARRLDAASSESAARADSTEVRLRERGSETVHVYDGWAWTVEADDDAPDFLPNELTEGDVTKKRTIDPSDDADPATATPDSTDGNGSGSTEAASSDETGTNTVVYETGHDDGPAAVHYCPNCGANLQAHDDPSFCPSCGESLAA